MHQPILRLIQTKLADGRLPHDALQRQWSGPGHGETCDGCGESVTKAQVIMEGVDHKVQFHLACFYLWDEERQRPGPKSSARLPARSAFRAPDARSGIRPWAPRAPAARPGSSASS